MSYILIFSRTPYALFSVLTLIDATFNPYGPLYNDWPDLMT